MRLLTGKPVVVPTGIFTYAERNSKYRRLTISYFQIEANVGFWDFLKLSWEKRNFFFYDFTVIFAIFAVSTRNRDPGKNSVDPIFLAKKSLVCVIIAVCPLGQTLLYFLQGYPETFFYAANTKRHKTVKKGILCVWTFADCHGSESDRLPRKDFYGGRLSCKCISWKCR